jgi:LysM repeat protein
MSAQNPFQIPDCFKLDLEQRRRERFKKTVVTAVIVSVAIVVGLLIEGCVSEKSQTGAAENSTPAPAVTAPSVPAHPAPQTTSQTSVPAQLSPVVATVQNKTATPVESSSSTVAAVYFVRSGDTLSRIARTHNTTIKALKSANDLATDKIVVGQKLKIPTA